MMSDYNQQLASANFVQEARVYYDNTDAGGVVYHAQYLNFMERCRSDWLAEHGLGVAVLQQQHSVVIVVNEVTVKYHAPARLADDLIVTCKMLQVGKIAMKMQQAIYNEGKLLCSATIKLATLDTTSFTLSRMPNALRDHFNQALSN